MVMSEANEMAQILMQVSLPYRSSVQQIKKMGICFIMEKMRLKVGHFYSRISGIAPTYMYVMAEIVSDKKLNDHCINI